MAMLTNNVFDCALVFEGGGYRAAYTSGIVNALLEEGIYFDFVCGLSAGASHTVDYVSRDEDRVRRAFLGMRGAGGVPGGIPSILRGKRLYNGDYLYEGCVEDGFLPFDFETFMANPARIAFSAFERDTGRTRVFTKDDTPTWQDLMIRVRASSTVPAMMKPKPVDGLIYYDGGLGEGAGIPLFMAEDAGFEKFFFVATRPAGYRKEEPDPFERRAITRLGSGMPYMRDALLTRWERYNAALDHLTELESQGKAFVVRPDYMPVTSTTMDPTTLSTAYDLGHAQAMRDMAAYKEFIFGDPSWKAEEDNS